MINDSYIKARLLDLAKSSPMIYRIILTIYRRRHLRFNRKRLKGKNNQIINVGVLNGVCIDVEGDDNRIEIDSGAVLEAVNILVRGSHNLIRIGADCQIVDSELWVEDQRCCIAVGARSTFGGVHCAATETESNVVIGEDCMFAYGIDIRTGDSHAIYGCDGVRVNKAQDVVIGNHVWICARAIILKGVTIGDGAIVGTGSVVARGVYSSHSIIVGNPGRIVRSDIKWSRSRAG